MTLEMTLIEAELLIALLNGTDGVFPMASPEGKALTELRNFRTRLLREYLHARIAKRIAGAR